MPTYDYHCNANGRTVEVRHKMSESVSTWGQLCEKAGISLDDTLPDSPVERLITAANVVRSSSLGNTDTQACATSGSYCGGDSCGLN